MRICIYMILTCLLISSTVAANIIHRAPGSKHYKTMPAHTTGVRGYICFNEQKTRLTMPTRSWHVYRRCHSRGVYPAHISDRHHDHPRIFCPTDRYQTFATQRQRNQWWHERCSRWRLKTV